MMPMKVDYGSNDNDISVLQVWHIQAQELRMLKCLYESLCGDDNTERRVLQRHVEAGTDYVRSGFMRAYIL